MRQATWRKRYSPERLTAPGLKVPLTTLLPESTAVKAFVSMAPEVISVALDPSALTDRHSRNSSLTLEPDATADDSVDASVQVPATKAPVYFPVPVPSVVLAQSLVVGALAGWACAANVAAARRVPHSISE
jgi:hypothetical protein